MKKEYVKMIVTLTLIATVCGFLLTAVKTVTQTKIEEQILVNVKGPALKKVLRQSTNDPIENRMDVNVDGISHTVFIGKKGEKIWAIAYESEGKGFGGKIGVMIGFNLEKSKLSGIGILTHQETPGLGARVSEASFTDKFKGRSISDVFKIKTDKGSIDAITGATNSSKGVCAAVEKGISLFSKIRSEVQKKSKEKVQ